MFDFDPSTGEIFCHDEIGSAWKGMVSTKAMRDALKAMKGKDVLVSINSVGGSCDEGFAIHNQLKNYPGRVTCTVEGVCASMATYILIAGDVRYIERNATCMIHSVWGGCFGNSRQFREQADVLDAYASRMVPAYVSATGQSRELIQEMMTSGDEYWLDAQESIDLGLCHAFAGESYTPKVSASAKPLPVSRPSAPITTAAAASARSPRESMLAAKRVLKDLDRQRREPLRRAKQSLRVCDRMSAVAARLEREEAWLIAD